MISGSLVILLLLVGVGYVIVTRRKGRKGAPLPPGPKGLPVLGNILQIDAHQHETYSKWAKEYGPIYKVDILSQPMVLISDLKLVKEAFSTSEFSGRMDLSMADFTGADDGKCYGVAFSYGPEWEELRRFTLRQLRDFGFGKSSMEESIMVEVNELMEGFKRNKDKPIDKMKDKLHFAVVNALWSIVVGQRYDHDDKELLKITKIANQAFNSLDGAIGFVVTFAPNLAKWAPNLSGFNEVKDKFQAFKHYFNIAVKEHKETIGDNFDRDFLDTFLHEIQKTKDPNSAFYGKTGDYHLMGTLSNLYFAGTDTTSSTLAWMILYLSKIPHIQRKLQDEIDSVVGKERPASLSDRTNMPYTEAVISETLRYSSILPQGFPHRTMQDVEFQGYFIPKGAVVIANQYHIHHDPKVWGDPINFRPERFLSSDEKTFKKHEGLLAFGIGRRLCIGESLARDNLFLFATNIFQKFSIEYDTTGPDHGFEPKAGFNLDTQEYRVILKER